MLTAINSILLLDEGIAVVCASPGWCRTNFTGGRGNKDAHQGAAVIIRAATEGNPKEVNGTQVVYDGEGAEYGW